MSCVEYPIRRRDFLKGAAALGLAWAAGRRASWEALAQEPLSTVPIRAFGKTGYQVSILALGGMFDIPNNQLLLRRALQMGVTYWDTADCYEGGRSEQGIGRFFASSSEARKKIFLVTKSDARDPAGMTSLLNRSLDRMKTDYVDLYFIHGLRHIKELTPDVKAWAERAKKDGMIRLFGFSTHANMAENLAAAARLGWVDGIMFTYNFRIMHEDALRRAVDTCAEAGIGLTAMKTQGGGPISPTVGDKKDAAAYFLARGLTPEQAKLKAVWGNPQIASICSQMPTLRILNANIAAAMDPATLVESDYMQLRRYAEITSATYCAGCAAHCETVIGIRLNDVMRCLMYDRDYNMPAWARREFARLPRRMRRRLTRLSLAKAQQTCPQHLPLQDLVSEAIRKWEAPGTQIKLA